MLNLFWWDFAYFFFLMAGGINFFTFLNGFLFGVVIENFGFGVINLIQVDVLSYYLSYLSIWILAMMVMMSFYIKNHSAFSDIFLG